jgi:hypothetical protein
MSAQPSRRRRAGRPPPLSGRAPGISSPSPVPASAPTPAAVIHEEDLLLVDEEEAPAHRTLLERYRQMRSRDTAPRHHAPALVEDGGEVEL